jgi:hypothetical protein
MRTLRSGVVLLVLVLVLGASGVAGSAEAAGPWRAQIVDAETGQPLEGVVVVASWIKYTAGPAGWAGGTYYAAEEAVTGADGRFVIPAKIAFNWLPFVTEIEGPTFLFFKPGYGIWRMRTPAPRAIHEEQHDLVAVFARDGAVIELPPLKTREERREFYPAGGYSPPPHIIPRDRTPRFYEAEELERTYLGVGR